MKCYRTLFFLFALLISNTLTAEGTREVAPNPQIFINGMPTNDIAALYIGNNTFGNFASYDNVNPQSRFHIHIKDPQNECIFLGFGASALNGQNIFSPFEFRVKDPNGNIIYGPILVEPNSVQINDWIEAFTGPQQIYGTNGYDALNVTSADLTAAGWSGAGDYYIEFQKLSPQGYLVDYWDVTVADCSGATPVDKKGRIWSQNWAIFAKNDFGFPLRPFNGAFYVCAPDPSNPAAAFITKVDFNGSDFRPAAFNVAFNSFGVDQSGNIALDRQSRQEENSTRPEYEIFLNDPSELCETAEPGDISLLGISRCAMDEFCIKFISTKEGQIDILLDFDGPDGVFTQGTRDVIITAKILASEVGKEVCLDWDGKDGLGNRLPESSTTQIPIVISYAQGIYHFPIYDAEVLTNGLSIESIRPAGPRPLLFYDDSRISSVSGSGEPSVQLTGCQQQCHSWTTFSDNNTPGFGNLNTINTWWFSAQVVIDSVFTMPGYYDCFIERNELCAGDTLTLTAEVQLFPPGANPPTIIEKKWSGTGIAGSNTGDSIQVTETGLFDVIITYINGTGDTCMTSCTGEVFAGQQITVMIDTLIVKGDTITIGGEQYSEAGRYTQTRTSNISCDSLIIIDVVVAQTTLWYDFNDCRSYKSDSTNADYTEFVVQYPEPLSCTELSADFLRRENPFVNPHSCTPGIDSTPAMCVGSLDTCFYDAGNQKSIIFEVDINPDPDTAVLVTELNFYERAPEMFDWIDGVSGPNNYPTFYGIRILKNGTEIFRQSDIPTNRNWTLQTYSLAEIPEMRIESNAILRFELLPYCTITDTIDVNAWDIDELTLAMACAPKQGNLPHVTGVVATPSGQYISGRNIRLSQDERFAQYQIDLSDNHGRFAFPNLINSNDLHLRIDSPNDDLNGINTKDVILMYRHLLGRPFLDHQWKTAAADINEDQKVNIRDLAYLRRLVIGYHQELPEASWIYGLYDASEDEFVKQITIPYIQAPMHANIMGVKLGDLDGSAVVGAKKNETRELPILTVRAKDEFVHTGDVVTVRLVPTEESIEGMQLAIQLNGLELQSWLNTDDNWWYHQNQNQIIANWYKTSDLNTGEIVMEFKSMRDGYLSELLRLSDTYSNEAYSSTGLESSSLEIEWEDAVHGQEPTLFPNPSNGTVYVSGMENIRVLSVTSLSGKRMAFSQQGRKLELKGSGVVVVTMQSENHVFQKKLVLKP